mmetsp:Transcript_18429/g.52028  ORF Transcript_18429/g.52028 Transcript_18429/m.52028 type:complete len:342 (+) Transcript_18429:157-1182(+)
MGRASAVLLCLAFCVAVTVAYKAYPSPLLAWSSSDDVLKVGRRWVAKSTSVETLNEDLLLNAGGRCWETTLLQGEEDCSPEVILLFLEPGLLFGHVSLLGGSRNTGEISEAHDLKNLIERSSSSVAMPYLYDLDISRMSEDDRQVEQVKRTQAFLHDFLSAGKGSIIVDIPQDQRPNWAKINLKDKRIVDASDVGVEQYLKDSSLIEKNGVTDLVIIHFSGEEPISHYASKARSTIRSATLHTDRVMSVLTSEEFYVPTDSLKDERDAHAKLDWVERTRGEVVPMEEVDGVCPYYTNRWPEYAFEMFLSTLALALITCNGLCCLIGIENPSKFDNPREKNM